MSTKKRYAVVGTGGRSVMFIEAIAKTFRDTSELVGFCDISQTRMNVYNKRLVSEFGHPAVPCYPASEFDRMVKEAKPDTVIVTSMDCTHHLYIIRAMELGCDVISEKPMTIDAEKANAIFSAIKKTGRKVRVSFNYRYAPVVTKVKELIMQGVVGKPLAVDFSWVLDTSHGADYFRRWHREKDKSGGLLVHKSTHHFDLVNWWLESQPHTVFAMGDLKFYGRKNAEERGEKYSYPRYTGVAEAAKDPFRLDLNDGKDDGLKGLYLDAEKDSGYIRDRNVFGEPISIEDTMAVMVRYRNNVIMNYSLIAYSPWEGYRVAITGTKGRLELYDKHGSHIIAGQTDDELAATQARGHEQSIRVFPMFGIPYNVEIPKAEGGHGGGDRVLLEQIFSENPPADPFKRAASELDGAASILVGISANESMRNGQPVLCEKLIPLPSF
ncbi:MAG: dehydrogenase [Lentisphaerae bacterium GWF2_52_8]|nr:MAG: dehydrogenase [Lentisphaerae bacterium GWF2_52_8]